jgi:hypothetical protein
MFFYELMKGCGRVPSSLHAVVAQLLLILTKPGILLRLVVHLATLSVRIRSATLLQSG